MLNRGLRGGHPATGNAADVNDLGLQFGDFGKRGVDRILDSADLGGDFISGIFDDVLTHDCSSSGTASVSGVAVGVGGSGRLAF